MPVLLHGGMLCPLELAYALGAFLASWPVVLYLWHKARNVFNH